MNRFNFIVLPLIVVAVLSCSSFAAQQQTSIADKIEPIGPQKQQQQQQLQQLQQQKQQAIQEPLPNRSPFLDTLFNIPIQTLRAVNELVQGIASGIAASQRGPFFPSRLQQQQQKQQQQQRQFYQDENVNRI